MKSFIESHFGYCPPVWMFSCYELMHDNAQELILDNAQDRNRASKKHLDIN